MRLSLLNQLSKQSLMEIDCNAPMFSCGKIGFEATLLIHIFVALLKNTKENPPKLGKQDLTFIRYFIRTLMKHYLYFRISIGSLKNEPCSPNKLLNIAMLFPPTAYNRAINRNYFPVLISTSDLKPAYSS
tara:strand:- start:272 stop:661 length:390 start_codon:yes stop_codon:yes gene_type:complete